MKKQTYLRAAAALLAAFVLWTAIVLCIDVQPIGPQKSFVGLASVNRFFHDLTGVHMRLYTITDWLSLLPAALAMGMALLGLSQWIRRKNLLKVDRSILLLGGFYIVVIVCYILFENCIVNYRPIRIDGVLEASYPSSTTLLVLCIMPTAAIQFRARIKSRKLRLYTIFACRAFSAFMVIGRLLSGVHWLSDIVGGILLSAGLVALYCSASDFSGNS